MNAEILRIIGLIVIAMSAGLSAATINFMNRFLLGRNVNFRESVTCSNITETDNNKYSIIVHGWRETCQAKWVIELARNLRQFRKGCIICMDYSHVAQTPNYLMLAKHTDDISALLADKLRELESRGYDPDNAFIFGFSLGGRIALEAGRMYGKQKIAQIDVCDNAGPGFDIFEQPDSKDSAQNVQCIHTSRDKGTRNRDCHQDWNMGFCGRRQMAAGTPPRGSHGLCPVFYNAAFYFDFIAEAIPKQCRRANAYYNFWPVNFKMGYMEKRKFEIAGEFYASTTDEYPYTPHTGSIESFLDLRRHKRKIRRRHRQRINMFRWDDY